MTLLLGIDLGTSYFKVGLFDLSGALRGLGRVAVTPTVAQPGRAELPVDVFWRLLRQGLAEARQQAGPGDIAGISYSSQANTFVLLDRHDAPLTPLVMWTDLRAEPLDQELAGFVRSADFSQHTGLGGMTGRSASAKAWWFQRNEPELWQRARRMMTISDYFTFALTGERVGDAGTAALLGIRDLTAGKWWPKALHTFGISEKMLSTALRPGGAGGRTIAQATALLDLPAGIPVAVGSLDHHVAALGAGVGSVADVSISTGTVLAALALTDGISAQPGGFHGPHFTGPGFFRLAFDSMGAGQLEDYQRSRAPDFTVEQLIAEAGKVSAGRQVDHRPRRDASVREHGMTVRYLLEKIAFTHRGLVSRAAGGAPVRTVVATGGGTRSDLWLQIKADMLGLPVLVPLSAESACLGAAMLAGVAAGVYPDLSKATEAMRPPCKQFHPDPANTASYRNWSPGISTSE
jgi:xylulokinase